MAVILIVVYTKGLKGFSGIAIGGIVGLDIFFFAFISDASMNRQGAMNYLWLYCTAPIYRNLISCLANKTKI
jgi:aquaporin Z